MNMKIYALDNESGIAIVKNPENNTLAALVNGKLYSVHDYRPINGDGRQLRADSQAVINRLYNDAYDAAALDAQREHEKLEAYAAEHAKIVEVEKEAPRENFADALQAAFLSTLTKEASGALIDKVLPLASEKLEKELLEKFGTRPVVHEIRIPEKPPVEITGKLHKDFDKIISMLADGESVYLVGEAGTGKSYLAQQAAKALGLEYYYTNSVTDDVQIKGFIDANGTYHKTQFYDAFVNGGIFLLDELDASIPEALILLNNALANGYFDFPTGRAVASPDFHAIAAGNTCGTGADNVYNGRYQLDAASLDRFALIRVDYDRDIEMEITGNDTELVDFAEDFRKAVKSVNTVCLMTYRGIKRLAKFSKYMSKADALKIAVIKGLSRDDVQYIVNKLENRNNQWAQALKSIC